MSKLGALTVPSFSIFRAYLAVLAYENLKILTAISAYSKHIRNKASPVFKASSFFPAGRAELLDVEEGNVHGPSVERNPRSTPAENCANCRVGREQKMRYLL
jgi:hypothetical protein